MKYIGIALSFFVVASAAWAQDNHVDVIVGFTGAPDDTVFAKNGGEAHRTLRSANAVSGMIPPGKIGDLRAQANVAYVVENGVVTTQQAHGQGKGSSSTTPISETTLPWGIQRIGADLVWTLAQGAGIKVGIVDTGIALLHPDLEANIAATINFVANEDGWDLNGHGSHVAGTIAAVDHLDNKGVIGVAPSAKLYAAKALNRRGSGTWGGVCAGIDWCVDNGVQVINLSLGGGDNTTLKATVAAAIDAGVLVVAASGNEYAGSPGFPAAYDGVLSVGAASGSATRGTATSVPSFSNRGCDISAPGVSILSDWKGTAYNTISGTSMATPHVVGVAALIFGKNAGITAADVSAHLILTAEDRGAPGFDADYGHGLVDAEKAVKTAP